MTIENPAEQATPPAADTPNIADQIVDLDAEQAEKPAASDTETVDPENKEAKVADPEKGEPTEDSSKKDDEAQAASADRRNGTTRNKARIAALEAENAALRSIVPKQDDAAALQRAVEAIIGPEPKDSDYADFLEYQIEKAAWVGDKRSVTRELKQKAAQAAEVQQSANAEIVEAFSERIDIARKTLKDFDEVMQKSSLSPQHPDVQRLIVSSEKGPELAYHLAKNPKIVQRLNEMSPVMAAREIGKLEASLSSATPRTVTKAPPPVEALKGGISSSSTKKPWEMSFDEYEKYRSAKEGK